MAGVAQVKTHGFGMTAAITVLEHYYSKSNKGISQLTQHIYEVATYFGSFTKPSILTNNFQLSRTIPYFNTTE
jgi:hypothetical protein